MSLLVCLAAPAGQAASSDEATVQEPPQERLKEKLEGKLEKIEAKDGADVNKLEGKLENAAGKLEGKLEETAPLSGTTQDAAALKELNPNADNSAALEADTSVSGSPWHLEGRLEQVGQPGATLPLELTSNASKNQPLDDIKFQKLTPKLDVMPERAPLQGGITTLSALASFPNFLVGTWGGQLRVLTRNIIQPDPADARLSLDELGTVVVRFVKEQEKVSVLPSAIYFERRKVDLYHHLMRREFDKSIVDDKKAKVFFDFPVIDLGSQKWQNEVGDEWQDHVLHNSLQRIGKNGAEQDIVFTRSKDGKPYGYRETVARFTWVSKARIFMQAAVVDYDLERKVRKQTSMEGYIVPDWHPFAYEIERITSYSWPEINKQFHLGIDW